MSSNHSSPDVNECLASPCSQECANIFGSYQCYCRTGYKLKEDGHTCDGGAHYCTSQIPHVFLDKLMNQCHMISFLLFLPDTDECTESIGHLCTYKCVNVPGSYQCACPEYGYTMSANGRSCRGEYSPPKRNQLNILRLLHYKRTSFLIQLSPYLTLHIVYSKGYAQINIIGTFTVVQ